MLHLSSYHITVHRLGLGLFLSSLFCLHYSFGMSLHVSKTLLMLSIFILFRNLAAFHCCAHRVSMAAWGCSVAYCICLYDLQVGDLLSQCYRNCYYNSIYQFFVIPIVFSRESSFDEKQWNKWDFSLHNDYHLSLVFQLPYSVLLSEDSRLSSSLLIQISSS